MSARSSAARIFRVLPLSVLVVSGLFAVQGCDDIAARPGAVPDGIARVGLRDARPIYRRVDPAPVAGQLQRNQAAGRRMLDLSFETCPGGFEETARRFDPETQRQAVDFTCLPPVTAPRLPSVVPVASVDGKPGHRVHCASGRAGDCVIAAVAQCPEGIEIAEYGYPSAGNGRYYSNLVMVGGRTREAMFYTFTCKG